MNKNDIPHTIMGMTLTYTDTQMYVCLSQTPRSLFFVYTVILSIKSTRDEIFD